MASIDAQVVELRLLLGEPVAADSLFTDAQVANWISSTSSMNAAAAAGWRAKMAHFANLVTTIDGASARNFSDLLGNAQEMVQYYDKLANARSGRSRVGRIVRSL